MSKKTLGFVLVTPNGHLLYESFRPTREASKGWTATIKMSDGRYHDWKHFYRDGWRCKPDVISVPETGASHE